MRITCYFPKAGAPSPDQAHGSLVVSHPFSFLVVEIVSLLIYQFYTIIMGTTASGFFFIGVKITKEAAV